MMKYFFISIFLFSALLLKSQEFRHYTAIQGLLGTDVTAICENENFLWIATNEGLNRFDGKEFKTYKKENNSTNCLNENNIETLMFDSNGFLWIGLKTGGVDIFDPKQDKFTHISRLTDAYPNRVICIFEDSKKNIWMGTWEEGIYKLEPVPGKSLKYKITRFYDHYIVSSIVEKPKGIIWAGTYNGFFIYDLNKNRWIDIPDNHETITQFLDTEDHNMLWCSTWGQGFLQINWKDNDFSSIQVRQYLKDYKNLYRIFHAGGNTFYLGTWGDGLKEVKIDSGEVRESPSKPAINASVILSFFRDKYNKSWVGTYGNGLYRLNSDKRGINYYAPINRNGISPVYKICTYNNNQLLIGTQGDGLFLYDLSSKQLIPKSFSYYQTLFTNYILSLYCDDELLIVGHDDAGIGYATFPNGKTSDFELKQFFKDEQLVKVTSIFKGKDSHFWLGTKQNGLMSVRYDSKAKIFTDFKRYDSLGSDEITGFSECDNYRLWISSHGGLHLFNTVTNKIEEIPGIKISEIIYSLVDDKINHCLWLGTSAGLKRMDYAGNYKVETVFPVEILPEGAIHNLLLDTENNLWFSIVDRVFCFINKERKLEEINTGIFKDQIFFSSSNVEINHKKQVAFGGTDNLLLVDPETVLHQPNQAKVVLTELQIDHHKVNIGEKVYGEVALNESTEYITSVSLSYLCKWISLSFSEIGWDYYHNKYQYHIIGFSDSWQYLDIDKPLTFSQLHPGNYTLSIRQYNTFTENEPCWNLQITVRPPWWQTPWFYLLQIVSIVSILTVVFFMVKNYYKKRQRQRLLEIEKRKKEELLQEKESFFAGLSHDLLTPFSLIIAPANDLLRQKNLTVDQTEKMEIISKNASFLSDIFSSILDMKRAESMDTELHEKTVELVAFIKIIVNAFDYLAKLKQISLAFHFEVFTLTVSIDTVKLERIIYNLLSNALKFTPAGGRVDLFLSCEDNRNHFTIKITDTGAGIDPKNLSKVFDKFFQESKNRDHRQGLGFGLYIVQNFVNMLEGELQIQSQPGQGTEISIRFPAKMAIDNISEDASETFADNNMEELPSILLVEDNDQLQNYLKKQLSAHFQVFTVSNGMEAMEFVKKNLPEIVISDIMMPEMDGLDFCSAVKSNPLLSDIFVVLLSALSSTDDELQGYKAGADFYVKKPFDSEILIKQIQNIYVTRQQRRKQIINSILSSPDAQDMESFRKGDFLYKSIRIIEEHLMDENFKIDEFASEMNVSKTVLHRKFKTLIGETPTLFIRNVKLHRAVNMLKETDLSVAEIAYLTGFTQSHYFIKCFKDLFGDTPKNFRKQFRNNEV